MLAVSVATEVVLLGRVYTTFSVKWGIFRGFSRTAVAQSVPFAQIAAGGTRQILGNSRAGAKS